MSSSSSSDKGRPAVVTRPEETVQDQPSASIIGAPLEEDHEPLINENNPPWCSPMDSVQTHDTVHGNWKTPHDTDVEVRSTWSSDLIPR